MKRFTSVDLLSKTKLNKKLVIDALWRRYGVHKMTRNEQIDCYLNFVYAKIIKKKLEVLIGPVFILKS